MSRKLSDFLIYSAIGIAMIIFVASCVTEKKRAEICKTCTLSSSSKDTSWSKSTVKRDTIYKSVVGPTVYLPSPCDKWCDSTGKVKPFKEVFKKNGITQTIEGRHDSIIVSARADSLQNIIEQITIENNHLKSETKVEPARCDLHHLTNLDSFFIVSGKCAWILLVILAIGWFLKKKFS